ncbi:MAG: dCTP deaminase [Thermoplasmata archaeon]|nr:MAG: dCTP deaminase [Thermoplasmata archaeon]
MSILSDADIQNAVQKGLLSIEPFDPRNLTPNGYDLSIDEIYVKKLNKHVRNGGIRIPPLTWFAVSTKEFIKIPPQLSAQLWIRSSYARIGVLSSFGKVDAGFHGTLTISCFNSNDEEIELLVGERFCQIVFEHLSSIPEVLYDKRSGQYHNQRGITLKK